jgi:hypothetical protein
VVDSSGSPYRYALLGIVGLVALVGVFLMLRLGAPLTIPEKTLAGHVFATVEQPFSIIEGQVKEVNVAGVDYTIVGVAVIPPDESPRDAVILRINNGLTGKIYEGQTKLQHGFTVKVESIEEGIAAITLQPSTSSVVDPPAGKFAAIDMFTLQEQKLYTIAGVDYQVNLTAVSAKPAPATATFKVNGLESSAIGVGQTIVVNNITITVNEIVRSPTKTLVSFSLGAPAMSCGSFDGQNMFCRGASACCGGSCVALPSCVGKPNGPVATCGQRQMYCCNQVLGFRASCSGGNS